MKELDFVKQENQLINSISSRGNLILQVVKLIQNLLEGNLKHQESITKNYSVFSKEISKIDICLKDRILQVTQNYSREMIPRNEKTKILMCKFSKLKSEIEKKFANFHKTLKQKKKKIENLRENFTKIQASKDDFLFQRWLASNRQYMMEREMEFQQELFALSSEIVQLDSQILLEFDQILQEIDLKKIASPDPWNPLEQYDSKARKFFFENLEIVKHSVTERVAFFDKKCKKMQLFTKFGDKVYSFSIVSSLDKQKMSEKYNFRQELQTMMIGTEKSKMYYFEEKTPKYTFVLSKMRLISVGMEGYIKITIPSLKWYKKEEKLTLYFRDLDEMKDFMETFELRIPGSIMGSKGKSKLSETETEESLDNQENKDSFVSEKITERIRQDSQNTLQNEALIS